MATHHHRLLPRPRDVQAIAPALFELPLLPLRGTDERTDTPDEPRGFDLLHRVRGGDLLSSESPRGHIPLVDQPELYGVHDTRARDAYAAILAREPWHWFTTLTFARDHERASGGMHPEKADKAFRFFIRALDDHIYGDQRETRGRSRHAVVWARGQEFHKDGKVHFHAVLAAPDRDLDACCSRYEWHEWWFNHFGRNQIEPPRSQDDVNSYVSKYVTKDGEVDFSKNFGTARPPRLFEVEPKVKHGRITRTESATQASGRSASPPSARERWGRGGLSLTPPLRQMLLLNQTHDTETRTSHSTMESDNEQ